jgi:Raf kinase inhibitor-like YbhB/YbcL family protein
MSMKKWLVVLIMIVFISIVLMFLIIKNNSVDFSNTNEQNNINMKIESDVFVDSKMIPTQYTCYGEKTQIPIKILDVPKEAKSLALIVDDPDAPNGNFVHWVIWNINPQTSVIENNNLPGAVEGNTSLGKPGWVAPCPPSGTHHYNFKLYALDAILSIAKSSTKADLISAMSGYIIENATLVGLYGRE